MQLAIITVAPLQNIFMIMARKILSRSIPMPDNPCPTDAKNVIVSSAENFRFASCGAVKPGFYPDRMARALYFCMAAKKDEYAM